MITETITYEDYPEDDGTVNTVTETLYFNIRESDLTENIDLLPQLEEVKAIVDSSGGTRTLEIHEVEKLLNFVKRIMQLGFGERIQDPRTGRKLFDQDGRWEVFKKSMAYDKFIMGMFLDPEKCMQFIAKLLPREMMEKAADTEGIDKRVLSGEITFEEAARLRDEKKHPMAMEHEGQKVPEPPKPVKDVPLPEETEDQRYSRLKEKKEHDLTREDVLFMMKYDQQKQTS